MSFGSERNSLSSGIAIFIFWITCGLSALGLFSSLVITEPFGIGWLVFCLMYFLLVIGIAVRLKERYLTGTGYRSRLNRFGQVLAVVAGSAALVWASALRGVPTVVHHITGVRGSMHFTLAGLDERRPRLRCIEKLLVNESPYFFNNYLCPDEDTLQHAFLGQKIVVDGLISSIGITPHAVRLVPGSENEKFSR